MTSLQSVLGPIKFGDILYMFPYANEIAIAYMTGSQIKTLFEKSVEYYNDTSSPNRGEFLHVSGNMFRLFSFTQRSELALRYILMGSLRHPDQIRSIQTEWAARGQHSHPWYVQYVGWNESSGGRQCIHHRYADVYRQRRKQIRIHGEC